MSKLLHIRFVFEPEHRLPAAELFIGFFESSHDEIIAVFVMVCGAFGTVFNVAVPDGAASAITEKI